MLVAHGRRLTLRISQAHPFAEACGLARESLLALKRFEHPNERFESRSLYAIRQRLAEDILPKESAWAGWGGVFPVVRYATVTLLLGLVAVYAFLSPPLQIMQSRGGISSSAIARQRPVRRIVRAYQGNSGG